jgi:hypothetical protein
MGDFWQHDIRLERILPLEPRKLYPVCTDGAGDCPPEDCGGSWGYKETISNRGLTVPQAQRASFFQDPTEPRILLLT